MALLGRSGVSEVEVGWEHNAGPRPGEWYAQGKWGPDRAFTEKHHDAQSAVEELCRKVVTGGECVHCGRKVVFGIGLVDGPLCSRFLAIDDDWTHSEYVRGCLEGFK